MARYQVILAYDGTEFKGFQRQANAPTIQGAVENALRSIGWQGKAILASGRTDTGVHAAGQVIAFDLEWQHTPQDLQSALNDRLPWSVVARSVAIVAEGFHPRYDASGRRYRYNIYCQPQRNPFQERFAWRLWPGVELEALQWLSSQLLGTHDYAAFGTSPTSGGSTLRTVSQACWSLTADGMGTQVLAFEILANAFLYRMARRLVYIQVAIAQGKLDQDMLGKLLASPPAKPVQGLAPACGLTLLEVHYPHLNNFRVET